MRCDRAVEGCGKIPHLPSAAVVGIRRFLEKQPGGKRTRDRRNASAEATPAWNADPKETSGDFRITKNVVDFLDAIGWRFGVGMEEPEDVTRRRGGTGIHL